MRKFTDVDSGRASARSVIISDSFLEAADLREALALREMSPTLHITDVGEAVTYLSGTPRKPDIVILGVELTDARAQDCLTLAETNGIRVLTIGSENNPDRRPGVHIVRPFGDVALETALSALEGRTN